MRIALVGLGDIARKAYLPVVGRHPEITPILCTRNRQTLRELSERYRIDEAYTDVSQLLDNAPDAVMIHSSTHSHSVIAEAALRRGIAVFVDKPLSDQLDESEALVNLALEKNVPLFCGFNRRYAPLYQQALQREPISVIYQKHRHNLPGDARTFVYDDFIHVLDFVRHCAGEMPTDLHVSSYCPSPEQLGSVQVTWHRGGASFTAAMNRLNGCTRERLEYSALNESWQVDNLRQGLYSVDNRSEAIGFGDWEDTLHKRGFVAMLESFLATVRQGDVDAGYLQGVLDSHRLCEQVVSTVHAEAQGR
ncbi:Gfo/Idh/MocA family protein [Gilvimarinus algae]|uniref:Gfo/Idh/MocA family oxidoreductase n=1 Tax=Gilvimarinus algae TaxID=3058037 RepID=A0ABT8TCI6_9GAMM|nr:Gfo/Idh/MocA family oxidoreductase [Gilvimarinus sp. SDUM040014]MDO3381824.1 Gfo/Idh/MocA family oxidoreductase [Gilvimarinus sp. SDUM040014]